MLRPSELVASPALRSWLSVVLRPRSERPVQSVALVEDLADVGKVDRGALVLLSRAVSATAGSYRFDMALRLGRTREVAALVVAGKDVGRITATAAAVADRSRTAILATAEQHDLAQLAVEVGRELAGGADVALLRAHAAVRTVEAHPPDGRRDALLEHAGAALGIPLAFGPSEPADAASRPVMTDGHVEGWVSAPRQEGELAKSLDVVLHAVADGLRQAIEGAHRAEELPIRSRDEVLGELLRSPRRERPPVVQRARSLGLEIDGWHLAVRVEIEQPAGASADEDAGYEQRLGLARTALATLRSGDGAWHSASAAPGVLLVRIYSEDPGSAAVDEAAAAMRPAVASMRAQADGAVMRCGVGGVYQGPAGLVASAREAKAAVTAARAAGSMNEVTPFDSVGLRRALVDWYALDTAQEAVTSVLAPLSRLGGARGERLIQTLHVYLDQQGSLAKTAALLNLHRNAVSYRVNQIFELLEIDPDNADDRLLLQLACRARNLTG